MYFLILPNQLFDLKYIDKNFDIILWECPHYFTDYIYNKKKLILHRASMQYYYDLLKANGYNVSYKTFSETLSNNEVYMCYEPLNKLEKLKIPNVQIYNKKTPNLLLNNHLINQYRQKTDKFFFNAFYMWSKKSLNIIPSLKSYDKMNRKTIKNKTIIKQPFDCKLSKDSQTYINEAIKYIELYFSKNYGNTNDFIFPITHQDAKKWLKHFIKHKFMLFGDYQDYIDKDDKYLYHSLMSSIINIGLINPIDIIKEINKVQNKIPLNSYEGFIRQLFWREYQYYCYLFIDYDNINMSNKKHLSNSWYDGTTNIKPLDDSIIEAFNTGYLHHIKRLMIVGNYMNLSLINPKEGFRWFMEFSCDSYEWVMYQNVYDMVFFVTYGKTTRRPYISSSAYILKMSNYKKENWCHIWDKKYYKYIKKNQKKLYKYRYFIRAL